MPSAPALARPAFRRPRVVVLAEPGFASARVAGVEVGLESFLVTLAKVAERLDATLAPSTVRGVHALRGKGPKGYRVEIVPAIHGATVVVDLPDAHRLLELSNAETTRLLAAATHAACLVHPGTDFAERSATLGARIRGAKRSGTRGRLAVDVLDSDARRLASDLPLLLAVIVAAAGAVERERVAGVVVPPLMAP